MVDPRSVTQVVYVPVHVSVVNEGSVYVSHSINRQMSHVRKELACWMVDVDKCNKMLVWCMAWVIIKDIKQVNMT